MDKRDVEEVLKSATFKSLLQARRNLSLPIVLIMIPAYFGFILLIAFHPSILAHKVGDSVVSIGIYAGLALLIISFALTALYQKLSEGRIAELLREIQFRQNQK